MPFARQYVMVAADDRQAELGAALLDLADKVRALPAAEDVTVFQDRDDPARFVFVERWASVEAYEAAGKQLGKDAFAPVMSAIGAPPEVSSLDCLTG